MAARGCHAHEDDMDDSLEELAGGQGGPPAAVPDTASEQPSGACGGDGGGEGCGRGGRCCSHAGAAAAMGTAAAGDRDDGSGGAALAAEPPARTGDGLSRDQKRGMGSWAAGSAPCWDAPPACHKCKAAAAKIVLQRDPLCYGCMEANALAKTRAIKMRGALSPGDAVAAAVSGGPCSLALLRALMTLHAPLGSTRPGKGRVAFRLVALHVQTAGALALGECGAAAHAAEVAAAVRSTGFDGELVFVPLHDVFQHQVRDCGVTDSGSGVGSGNVSISGGGGGGRGSTSGGVCGCGASINGRGCGASSESPERRATRLFRLLAHASRDATGREDLCAVLLADALHGAAAAAGCNRLALGDTSSRMAVRVVAEAAKEHTEATE